MLSKKRIKPMSSFQKLNQSHPRYARFFKKLVESELKGQKEQDQVLNRIARNFHTARQSIKNRNVDLFAVKSVESLEDLLYKTHRDSKVERYAKDALSGAARRRNVLQGPGRERALQAFGRIMDLKLPYEEKQKQFFKGISAVKTSEGLADMLENLLDSETMEKVADSKAVVEYDDGRMALAWIPDFETSNKVGSHEWCISRSDGGETYWNDHAEGLNKCYMIVDRALPASHLRHKFAFHIGPDGDVTASHDQFDGPIDAKTDKGFQQALKLTGARPYSRDDVLRFGDDAVIVEYMEYHGDLEMLSKRVLTANNPANELGKRFKAIKSCAENNLPAYRNLILAVAKQCAKKETGALINESFVGSVYKGCGSATDWEIGATLAGIMPSIAAIKKYCMDGVTELFQSTQVKNEVFRNAILFGNRALVVDLINSLWVMPHINIFTSIKREKILSLGAKTTRLLLNSVFNQNLWNVWDKAFVKALLFPTSQAERESAEVYFSIPRIKHAPELTKTLLKLLQEEQGIMAQNQSKGVEWHGPLLENLPWRIDILKRVLGENSEPYAEQIGWMLAAVAGDNAVETGVVHYLPQINLLLDEVDRLKKEGSKKALVALGRVMNSVNGGLFLCPRNIKFAQQPLSENSRLALGRLLETMKDYGADVSMIYMSLLAREGEFSRIASNRFQSKDAPPMSRSRFLYTALGRYDFREGRLSEQWLTAAESWLKNNESQWFNQYQRDIIARLFSVLRGRTVSANRLVSLIEMASSYTLINPLMLGVLKPRKGRHWSEVFHSTEDMAEFLQITREMKGRVSPEDLSKLLLEVREPVRAWAFSVGWDDIMGVVDDDNGSCGHFINDLLGFGFCDRDTINSEQKPELSDFVKWLATSESPALVNLAQSVECTVPNFNGRAFANAVNTFHGEFSTGDIMPLKDTNTSDSSHCLS